VLGTYDWVIIYDYVNLMSVNYTSLYWILILPVKGFSLKSVSCHYYAVYDVYFDLTFAQLYNKSESDYFI